MGSAFSFNNSSLWFDCPICGKPKSPPDSGGQSISFIARACFRDGACFNTCNSCGAAFSMPASIFSDGVLAEFERVEELPGDQLHGYIEKNYVATGTMSRLLKSDWYDILQKANRTGPLDAKSVGQNETMDAGNADRRSVNLPNGGFINITKSNIGVDIDLVDKARNIFDSIALRRGTLFFISVGGREEIDNVVEHLREVEDHLPADVREALPKPLSSVTNQKKWWRLWR